MDKELLVILGSTAVGGFYKLILDWHDNRRDTDETVECFYTLGEIHQRLITFCEDTDFDRIVIYKVENRRGNRELSIILEHTTINSIYSLYQGVECSKENLEFLQRVKQEESIDVNNYNLYNLILIDTYKVDNIQSAKIFYITKGKKYTYYGCCHSQKIVDFDNPNTKIYYKALMAFIRPKFVKYAP